MKERVVEFGPSPQLVGMIHRPETLGPEFCVDGALLLNAGIVHRVGPHRLGVKLARHLGAAGLSSLRFDLSGLGDSPARPDAVGAYWEQAALDTATAADALATDCHLTGRAEFAAIGMCSGADHAYRAALADERLTRLVLIDPFAYENPRAKRERLLEKARDPARWQRVARRLVGQEAIGQKDEVAGDVVMLDQPIDDRDIMPLEEFGRDLQTLTARGVRILIVYTNFVEELLTRPSHFFESFAAFNFQNRLSVDVTRDTDHTHTALAAQSRLFARITTFLQVDEDE